MTDVAAADIGHNLPPEDVDPLQARLKEDYADDMVRTDKLLESVERAPLEVTKDNIGQMSDFAKQLHDHAKSLQTSHGKEKEFFLKSGRTVDAFFKRPAEALIAAKRKIEDRITRHQIQVAEAERKRREAEEREAREEAERLAREAEKAAAQVESETDLTDAVEAEEAAEAAKAGAIKAEKAASAKAADLTRERGDASVTSLRTFWAFRIDDARKIDLEALRPHFDIEAFNKAIRAFMKANKDPQTGKPTREIAGVTFYQDQRTNVR